MSGNEIPFLDLTTPHLALEEELMAVVRGALRMASFIGGPSVEGFERAFAEFCDTRHAIGLNSGTDALRFALLATGVGEGDSVVTVPNTFIATTEAVSQVGARPEFVDVHESTYNMDPEKLRQFLEQQCRLDDRTGRLMSKRTGRRIAAVVPVHLYGQMADMDPILELAELYKLTVIEDACQAHGAEYFSKRANAWKKAGSMGVAAAFSFYPGKNLGACGEAGAVTTNDAEISRKVRMIRDHGQAKKYYHEIEGYNGRLDAIQAGILTVKLLHLPKWNASRARIANRYRELFSAASAPVTLPFEPSGSKPVHHLYVIQVDDRETVQRSLAAEGIGTGIHYPIPLHLQNAYKGLGVARGKLPVTESAADRILSLPMFPTLSDGQLERIVSAVVQSSQPILVRSVAAGKV